MPPQPPSFTALSRSLFKRRTNPSIFPLPKPSHGHTITEFGNRNKRVWRPNITKIKWPVTLLGGEDGWKGARMKAVRMKMTMKGTREVDRRGGLEAALVGTHSSKLSKLGRQMRAALLDELGTIRDELEQVQRKAVDSAAQEPRIPPGAEGERIEG